MFNYMVAEVVISEAVYVECLHDLSSPETMAARDSVGAGRIEPNPASQKPRKTPMSGCQHWARANWPPSVSPCAALMDERLERQVAGGEGEGLTVIGSAGLLIAAKLHGLIPAVTPILDQWRRLGFFLSAALVEATLERADEA